MMKITRRHLLAGTAVGLAAAMLPWRAAAPRPVGPFAVARTDEEWHRLLPPERYAVLREEDTEPPFTSPLLQEKRSGGYACAGCGNDLFASATKYDSRTGWPSFWAPLEDAVGTTVDTTYGMTRTEVHCRRCGSHLGHVFDDGPQPTGLRYCMNGLAMIFRPAAA